VWTGYSIVLLVALYLPIAVVVLYSFNSSRFAGVWSGITIEWYRTAFADDVILSAAWNSLVLALTSSAIATLLGTLLGFGLAHGRLRVAPLLEYVMYIPVVISDIVMAITLVSFFAWVRSVSGLFQLGLPSMIVAHVTFQIPFVAIVVRARLRTLPRSLEEAAIDLGATPWQTVRFVILPMARPAIFAGALLAFTLSLDDFVLSFFTSGPGATTLPIFIYSSVKRGITPEVNVVSALLLTISIGLTVVSLRLQRRT
jgi:spermidine/putrescine transport system permease protein